MVSSAQDWQIFSVTTVDSASQEPGVVLKPHFSSPYNLSFTPTIFHSLQFVYFFPHYHHPNPFYSHLQDCNSLLPPTLIHSPYSSQSNFSKMANLVLLPLCLDCCSLTLLILFSAFQLHCLFQFLKLLTLPPISVWNAFVASTLPMHASKLIFTVTSFRGLP